MGQSKIIFPLFILYCILSVYLLISLTHDKVFKIHLYIIIIITKINKMPDIEDGLNKNLLN